jgi:hypothetical protein
VSALKPAGSGPGAVAAFGPAESDSPIEEVIVFTVMADPEPDQSFRTVPRQHAVVQTYPRRSERSNLL